MKYMGNWYLKTVINKYCTFFFLNLKICEALILCNLLVQTKLQDFILINKANISFRYKKKIFEILFEKKKNISLLLH